MFYILLKYENCSSPKLLEDVKKLVWTRH